MKHLSVYQQEMVFFFFLVYFNLPKRIHVITGSAEQKMLYKGLYAVDISQQFLVIKIGAW